MGVNEINHMAQSQAVDHVAKGPAEDQRDRTRQDSGAAIDPPQPQQQPQGGMPRSPASPQKPSK